MDNRISNDYISNAIDELVSNLGVKEEPPMPKLLALLWEKKTRQCIKEIAQYLGLAIEINLSYVPKDYKAGNTSKFESRQLVRTDWRGRGVESITAQVFIPENMPIYGTSTLKGFPINVRVSENCHECTHTFIGIMAHELSHVLLHSLHHPQKNNEVYTDLTPMILGFSRIVEEGRKTVKITTAGNTTTTHTTMYGYLTDSQFSFAREKINTLLEKHRRDKVEVMDKVSRTGQFLSSLKRNICQFKILLGYLDEHQNRKIKRQDGPRIVQFHSFGYTSDIEMEIGTTERLIMEAKKYCTELKHYTNYSAITLHNYTQKIDSIVANLEQHNQALKEDLRILSRNLGLAYRIKVSMCTSRKSRQR